MHSDVKDGGWGECDHELSILHPPVKQPSCQAGRPHCWCHAQADRARTQAELQRAQEHASSLQEDLALIRSTLLPLAVSREPLRQADASIPAAMLASPHREQMQPALMAAGSPAAESILVHDDGEAYSTMQLPPPAAAAGPLPRTPGQMGCQAGGIGRPAADSPSAAFSPAARLSDASVRSARLARSSSTVAEACSPAARASIEGGGWGRVPPDMPSPGALAGLVSELQADVEKLQHQLNSSRRQLKWDSGREAAACGTAADAR